MDEAELAVKRTQFKKGLEGPNAWFLIIIVMGLLPLAVSYFGGDLEVPQPTASETPGPTQGESRTYTVEYRGGVFSPTNLRIRGGDTVRFKNESLSGLRITSDDIVGFDSIGDIPPGSHFSFTFAARGTFGYHNYRNKSERGTIIVR